METEIILFMLLFPTLGAISLFSMIYLDYKFNIK